MQFSLIDHQLSRNSPGSSELNFQPYILHLLRLLREGQEEVWRAGRGVRGKASLKTKYSDSVFQSGILLLLRCICQAQPFVLIFALLPSYEAYVIKKWEHKHKKKSLIEHVWCRYNLFSSSLDILPATLDTVVWRLVTANTGQPG